MKRKIIFFILFLFVIGFKLKTTIISFDFVNITTLILIIYLILFKNKFFRKLNIHVFNMIMLSCIIAFITILSIAINGFISFELISIVVKLLLFTIASYSLVLIYMSRDKKNYKINILYDLYLAISIHSIIIILMYISPIFREFIYSYSDISDLEKLKHNGATRVAGLTGGGGALSSLLQATGLILFFYIKKIKVFKKRKLFLFYTYNLFTLISIVIVGRTGLFLFLIVLPFIIYSLYGINFFRRILRIFNVKRFIIIIVILCIGIILINYQSGNIVEKFIDQSLSRATNLSYGFTGKKTNAITILLEMLYIPDLTNYQYIIGTSTTGRTKELWLNSDIGYVRMFFAYGIMFLIVLTPYFYILLESLKVNKDIYAKLLLLFTILILIVNIKELMFFGRHLFVINLILFFVAVFKNQKNLSKVNEIPY